MGEAYIAREKRTIFHAWELEAASLKKCSLARRCFCLMGGIECTYFMTGRSHATQFFKGPEG